MKEGEPSATARLIAAAMVAAPHRPETELVPGAAVEWSARLLSSRAQDRRLLRSVRSSLWRWLWRRIEGATLPGVVRHWVVRKWWIERAWRASVEEGFTQLVVLGAGLDTLGVRVAGEGARVVELDHPATQGLKRAGVGEAAGLTLIPCNLGAERITDALVPAGGPPVLDRERPTVVVCEGVLMYLSDQEVRLLLAEVAGLPVPRLRLVITQMDRSMGQPRFGGQRRVVTWWLRRRMEPFRSGATPSELRELLEGLGFENVAVMDVATVDPEPARARLRGELLAQADRRA